MPTCQAGLAAVAGAATTASKCAQAGVVPRHFGDVGEGRAAGSSVGARPVVAAALIRLRAAHAGDVGRACGKVDGKAFDRRRSGIAVRSAKVGCGGQEGLALRVALLEKPVHAVHFRRTPGGLAGTVAGHNDGRDVADRVGHRVAG